MFVRALSGPGRCASLVGTLAGEQQLLLQQCEERRAATAAGQRDKHSGHYQSNVSKQGACDCSWGADLWHFGQGGPEARCGSNGCLGGATRSGTGFESAGEP